MGQSTSSETTRQSKSAPQSIPKFPSKITVQWEWQSSETQQWIPYEPADNYLLEKAYRNKREKVDLGDVIVILKGPEMVQQAKNDVSRQNQVRRNGENYKADEESKLDSEEKISSKARFSGIETPKTYTRTLVCLENFLVFFENRGPEIQSFVNIFKEIEYFQDMDRLNKEIVPLLVDSLKAEAIQSKKNQEGKEILDLIQKEFTNFNQFYGDILKAYSIDGFLTANLNQYLKNEDWIGLDCLLPYASCLCKAFIWVNNTENSNIQGDNEQNTQMTLYRGAQLDEGELRFYDSQAVPTFSWNGVTSASADRKTAEQMMYAEIDSKKTPVMFAIEIPMSPEELKNSKWIDVKPFSVHPEHGEIVLGPGSIFKLTRYRRDHKGIEMSLRLVAEVNPRVIEQQIMLGAIQAELARNRIAKIGPLETKNPNPFDEIALEKHELEECITYLKGNKLFEGLELRKCKFDAKSLAKLRAILSTLQNLRSLACVSLSSKENNHLDTILQTLNKKRIHHLEINDELPEYKEDLSLLGKRIREFTSLSSLNLNFSSFRQVKTETLIPFCNEGLRHMTSLRTLDINFAGCYFLTDVDLANFSSYGLKYLPSLTDLTLSFSFCKPISDTGITNLCEGLRCLTSLTRLSLDFYWTEKISDEGLMKLYSEGLRHLTSLTTLILHLDMCGLVTKEGLTTFLAEGISQMTSLTTINIDYHLIFSYNLGPELTKLVSEAKTKGVSIVLDSSRPSEPRPPEVWQFKRKIQDDDTHPQEDVILSTTTDAVSLNSMDELEEFYSKDIEYCQQLRSLTLKCSSFGEDLNDEKLTAFCTQRIQQLASLTALTLDFAKCKQLKITNEFLTNLCSEGLIHLTSLTVLTLDFGICPDITDKGLTHLGEGLKNLTSLTTLNLNFASCVQITAKGLASFCSEGLRHLPLLTALSLDCSHHDHLTDADLSTLCCEGIRHLTSLKTLTLSFAYSRSITDKGLTNLGEGLKNLSSLTTLSLHLAFCDHMTGDGLASLFSRGLRYLPSLTTLSINGGYSHSITDEGLITFCCEGIRHLTSVKILNLEFPTCMPVSFKGLRDVPLLIKFFGYEIQA